MDAPASAPSHPPARGRATAPSLWLALPVLTLLLSACMPTRWEEPPDPGRDAVATPGSRTAPAPGRKPAHARVPPATTEPRDSPGNPPFYEVFGQRYFVLPDSAGFREEGVASWYGREFHGQATSTGEIYDMNGLTAAHRTLPLPSRVRVTNLDNGRSVVVTVNDRGPFAGNRVIDMSYGAAQQLGMVEAGLARVRVEAVADGSTPPREAFMQVGAFRNRSNAEALVDRLSAVGIDNVVIREDTSTTPATFRVRIGPLRDVAEYDALALRLAPLNISGPRVVAETPAGRPGG